MSETAKTPVQSASIWIISPVYDLALLIATPLAIVPMLSLLAQYRFSPEEIALAVFSFASLGHHLPGFLRAYGDRELFQRYRWRFLLGPPLALAASWASFVWLRLHGLELLLLFWATWHILMQTYGFMRIYDLKKGATSIWDARLNFWACIAVFASGVVFSDARMFGIVETFWLTGSPLFDSSWLMATRWLVGIGTGLILTGLLLRTLQNWRHSTGVCWLKLLLLVSTAALYWSTGQLSVNLLVGVAMFEIFHAVQYFAIVWLYNRQQAARHAGRKGPLAAIFRRNWWGLPVYLLMIAAFGSLGLLGTLGDTSFATRMAMALFSASAMLHFYYDGFIWKMRDKKTSENLQIDNDTGATPGPNAHRHALIWGLAASLLVALSVLEYSQPPASGEQEQRRLAALAALTPELPELQLRVSQSALLHGEYEAAYSAARKAVALRKRSYSAQLALGNAAAKLADWDIAQRSYRAAADLRPDSAEALLGLGTAYVQREDYAAARESLQTCLQVQADSEQAHFQLGNVYYFTREPALAIECYRRCVELQPNFADAYTNLGSALLELNQWPDAADAYRNTIRLRPEDAAAHYNLGLVMLYQGATIQARSWMLRAEQLGQPMSPEVAAALGL